MGRSCVKNLALCGHQILTQERLWMIYPYFPLCAASEHSAVMTAASGPVRGQMNHPFIRCKVESAS